MDALIEKLPTVTEGYLYVLYYENEQNVMTKLQAVAAKAKGWTLYYCSGFDDEGYEVWDVYEGGVGIEEIKNEELRMKNEESTDAVFDLGGRRVNGQWSMINGQLPQGLYIVGGKKIANK